MRFKVGLFLIILSIFGMILIVPVIAGRTEVPPSDKFISMAEDGATYYCMFSKAGWQEWIDADSDGSLDGYIKYLYAQRFGETTIAEMMSEGWKIFTIDESHRCWGYVEPYIVSIKGQPLCYDILYQPNIGEGEE